MTGEQTGVLLRHIRRLTAAGTDVQAPDQELLERFAARHDEAAFAALVRRHGAMVLGVCRRVLKDWHEAEDTFQATFLALAQKAGSVRRRESLASWLYAVAYHLAVRARANAARRASLAARAPERRVADPLAEISGRELLQVLDEEVRRLPEKLRAPVLLCYLEAHTQDEAARQLGWTGGTLRGRLERGRERLRRRLAQRGLTLPGALLVTVLSRDPTGAASSMLAAATVRIATAALTGPAVAGAAPARIAALAGESVRGGAVGKMKLLALFLAACLAAAAATGALVSRPLPEDFVPAAQDAGRRTGEQEAGGAPSLRADLLGDPLPPGALARFGTVRLRQGRMVDRVLFAPDGKSVVSLGWTNPPIRFWDSRTGKELRALGGPGTARQRCLAFSPDRRTLASGGVDGVIHLWRSDTGKEIRSFSGHVRQVTSLAFSPDGARLAVACSTKELPNGGRAGLKAHIIRLFEATTGKEIRHFKGHEGWVNGVAFAPDGRLLASGSVDGTARLWDVATGGQVRRFGEGSPSVEAVAFSPDGALLASEAEDGSAVRLWEVKTGRAVRTLRGHSGYVTGLTFAADGRTLASTGKDAIRIWDVASGREAHRFHADLWGAPSVALSPDGKTLAASGPVIRLWDIATEKELLALVGHQSAVCSAAFSPDGRLVASAAYDQYRLTSV